MSDETTNTNTNTNTQGAASTPPTTTSTTPTPPIVAAPVAAKLDRYIAQHTIQHDGVEFAPGALFQSADTALLADLRAKRAIKLEVEVLAAEELARRQADQERLVAEQASEIDALKAQVAELNAKATRSAK